VEKTKTLVKKLKRGGFVIIDEAPCRVIGVVFSAPGKHGAVKARIEAIGLLDERKRSIVSPADETIDVPIIVKKSAQVLAVVGERAQLMDLADYSVFELPIPNELKERVRAGEEISYYEVCGERTLKPIKG
jgi:translation initiation factor 5A